LIETLPGLKHDGRHAPVQRRRAAPLADLHFHRMITVVVQQGDDITSERLTVE
jgi:hypothetical protein